MDAEDDDGGDLFDQFGAERPAARRPQQQSRRTRATRGATRRAHSRSAVLVKKYTTLMVCITVGDLLCSSVDPLRLTATSLESRLGHARH